MEQYFMIAADTAQAEGGLVMILFLFFMVLLVWCLIMFDHIKKGWKTVQKIFDIIITILILATIAMIALPMMK